MSDNIIEKIRKLLAMASDAGATEGEQANALRLATALMTKHGIEKVDQETGEVKWGDKVVDLDQRWHHIAAMAIGKMYGARAIFSGKNFSYVGRDETVMAATMTINFVADQIELFYKAGLPKGMSRADRAQWRREFKVACAIRVSTRINEMMREITTEDDKAQLAIGCKALVVATHHQNLQSEIDSFLEGKTKSKSISMKVAPSRASYLGFKAGDNVRLNQELAKNKPLMIGSK